jgi:MFS transporter, DHA1 family, inner membrane transport protein
MSPLLFALFLATFAIGTTEFAVVGLLPDIAASLDVSISRAGLLVSGYALGVAIGGPVIVALTSSQPRKRTLLPSSALALRSREARRLEGRFKCDLRHSRRERFPLALR